MRLKISALLLSSMFLLSCFGMANAAIPNRVESVGNSGLDHYLDINGSHRPFHNIQPGQYVEDGITYQDIPEGAYYLAYNANPASPDIPLDGIKKIVGGEYQLGHGHSWNVAYENGSIFMRWEDLRDPATIGASEEPIVFDEEQGLAWYNPK
jgi:hypothetical protein